MEYKNSQEYKLFYCPECHTIFKCKPLSSQGYVSEYITDYGDIILSRKQDGLWLCKCSKIHTGKPINCEDWVAEKVFSIKGDTPTSKPLV